jgi:hypothetical protein
VGQIIGTALFIAFNINRGTGAWKWWLTTFSNRERERQQCSGLWMAKETAI